MGKENSQNKSVAPKTELSINSSQIELFLHFRQLSLSKEADDDNFTRHYNNLERVRLGLKSGFMDYDDARPYLSDLINSDDPLSIFPLHFSWFEVLTQNKNYKAAGDDAEKLKRTTIDTVRLLENPATQAQYFAYFIDAARNFLTPVEINSLLAEQVESIEKFLSEKTEITPESTGSLIAFVYTCRKSGYYETETITEHLIQMAKDYDPKKNNPFTTFRLIQFLSDEEIVSPWVREDFVEKVLGSLPGMEHGVLNKEIVIEGLIPLYLELGNVEEAYKLLSQIKEPTSYLHAVGSFLMDSSRNLARIDHLFYTSFLSLVADQMGTKVENLSERFINAQRRMWTFHKFLRAKDMAKYKKKYDLFKDEEVLTGITGGTLPTAKLSDIAELVEPEYPESIFLAAAISTRIRQIFLYRIYGTETEETLDAIAALIILKNKGVLPTTL